MAKYYKNGKLVKCKELPNGLYKHFPGKDEPTMIDEHYNGWRIIYPHVSCKEGEVHGRAPYCISDTLDGVVNPVDGKRYDSKSKYYRTIKDAGCEVIGNDSSLGKPHQPKEMSSSERKRDIAQAINQLGA